jgi:alpha-galactosidase
MPKITFIGAGSTVFAKNLLGDILSFPELSESTISLMDIDPERLNTTRLVAERIAKAVGAHPRIEATLNRREALDGADYAISMFQVGGYRPSTVIDFDIPRKYGLQQTIADTLGIGGIMRALRTIPVLLDVAHDMEELCPDATFLNYVNPMAMNMWALNRGSKIKNVGLCHSVQGTAMQLATDIQIPFEEINYISAGINHMAFYLKFERKTANGVEDLYPLIRKVYAEGRAPDWNRVRYEMCKRLGYFVTESSEHFSEYTPWFIKRDRPDLIEQFNVPIDEYIRRCEVQLAGWEATKDIVENPSLPINVPLIREKLKAAGASDQDIFWITTMATNFDQIEQSHEYGSYIIHSLETGISRVIYGNVANHDIISNLPEGCTVEVPCLVDKNGIQPTRIGALPPQLAAVIQTNVNVQGLAVEAAMTHEREHIYHAAMMDPHTAAELDLDQIWRLVDDLIEAHGDMLPKYH